MKDKLSNQMQRKLLNCDRICLKALDSSFKVNANHCIEKANAKEITILLLFSVRKS